MAWTDSFDRDLPRMVVVSRRQLLATGYKTRLILHYPSPFVPYHAWPLCAAVMEGAVIASRWLADDVPLRLCDRCLERAGEK